jgi:hypothetical protein
MFGDSDRRDKKIKVDSEKLEFHKSLLSAFASSRWPPILPFVLFVAVWVDLVFIKLHAYNLADLWIEELSPGPFLRFNA